ncbi:uncharacterized metal-dependent hydrolase YabD-like isoform X2 [Zingiber officinale]|uniref:uncharacterized metal-dependent hydrolase YabD-like isoform X2 n=1 Tax=Zingiber officinale TaxID=94328 RepID=UPI001C4CF8C2|nr:uncharacterized metal-dependent hydrolase YabD-like isoform X2 [Zingiber officinale]
MSGVGVGRQAEALRLFDAHCHLQDRRIAAVAPHLIRTALDCGVQRFAVNGVSEADWHIVKQMGDEYPSIIPCFGLHPWFVAERSPYWFRSLKEFLSATPAASVGEIGLDKGSHGRQIDFAQQPATSTCQRFKETSFRSLCACFWRPFGNHVVRRTGPFPDGVILHSYMGSAESVSGFAKLGSYFSFSGFLTSMKPQKAKKLLLSVPKDRILIETDSPDGLPTANTSSWIPVPVLASKGEPSDQLSDQAGEATRLSKETLNHPANLLNVLKYVATLLEISEEELAQLSFENTVRLFSYPGSKISSDGS